MLAVVWRCAGGACAPAATSTAAGMAGNVAAMTIRRGAVGSGWAVASGWRTASTTAAATTSATAGVTSGADAAARATAATPSARAASAEAVASARVASVFYDPTLTVTRRQRDVYRTLADEPPMPLLEDHGFIYDIPAAQLANRNDMVKRALSTRTANVSGTLAFRRSELQKKFGTAPHDTGASRVQVAMLTERINRVSSHLSANKHDKKSKRALSLLTVRRRKLLEYMQRRDFQGYRLVVSELALRPVPLFYGRHLPKERVETHKEVKERHGRLKNRVSHGGRGH